MYGILKHMEITSPLQFVFVFVGILLLGALIAYFLRGSRNSAFEKLAKEFNLEFSNEGSLLSKEYSARFFDLPQAKFFIFLGGRIYYFLV